MKCNSDLLDFWGKVTAGWFGTYETLPAHRENYLQMAVVGADISSPVLHR